MCIRDRNTVEKTLKLNTFDYALNTFMLIIASLNMNVVIILLPTLLPRAICFLLQFCIHSKFLEPLVFDIVTIITDRCRTVEECRPTRFSASRVGACLCQEAVYSVTL